MLSDLGTMQVTVGHQPAVDRVEDDGSDVIVQSRPHRDDTPNKQPDLGGRPPPKPPPQQVRNAAPAGPMPIAAATAGHGDAARKPTAAELRAELERQEKQAFDQAAQQIRDAVSNDPQLQELAQQLAIDMTPDGLRIQIRDADRQPMFAFGSADPNEKARLLLQKVAPVLTKLTQDISIAGHTDAAPFIGTGRTNWELSADRANTTRRLLLESGLQEARIRSVTGNAERDLAVPSDPLAAANRRITIVVLRSQRQPQDPP
jgi:chemotaxis protein MotB